jgi:hypothetical protein
MRTFIIRFVLKLFGANLRDPKTCSHTTANGGHTFTCFDGVGATEIFICTQCGLFEIEG